MESGIEMFVAEWQGDIIEENSLSNSVGPHLAIVITATTNAGDCSYVHQLNAKSHGAPHLYN